LTAIELIVINPVDLIDLNGLLPYGGIALLSPNLCPMPYPLHLPTLHSPSLRRTLVKRMRVLRQFGVLGLLLVSCLTPAMACMVPDAQMNAQERACCRMMNDQCGQMGMAASHGCCQKTPQRVYISAPVAKTATVRLVPVTAIWLTASELLNPSAIVARWVDGPEYSPPKSPPSTVSILRI
jgi:hypothetical protein